MAVGVPLLRVPDDELYNSKRMKLNLNSVNQLILVMVQRVKLKQR
jgi:NADPH-dependent 7-cyano-7-deazaguanine reductase QueF-like protein